MAARRVRANKDRSRINRLLGAAGLGQLEDPGVVAQLAYLVQGHAHFREIINACEPQDRTAMYNAMRPHLHFTPLPLDVYIAQIKEDAEHKQLPTVTADGGLAPFKIPEINTVPPPPIDPAAAELARVNATIKAEFAKKTLELECRRCLRTEQFHGEFKSDCNAAAACAGWRCDESTGFETRCPEHAPKK